jgi:D-glycero-D-manno-heptose 1,7-bisphosphate phosphatase
MSRAGVFLDRDGVLNAVVLRDGSPHPPASAGEVQILPDVQSAVARLRNGGFELVVVSNQPDVARGVQARDGVEAINEVLRQELGLDHFRVCYHDDADGCECRKPKPGLILDAAREFGLDLGESVMIGDRWRDVDAGNSAGCRTILLEAPYSGRGKTEPDLRLPSLSKAVDWILNTLNSIHEKTL